MHGFIHGVAMAIIQVWYIATYVGCTLPADVVSQKSKIIFGTCTIVYLTLKLVPILNSNVPENINVVRFEHCTESPFTTKR